MVGQNLAINACFNQALFLFVISVSEIPTAVFELSNNQGNTLTNNDGNKLTTN